MPTTLSLASGSRLYDTSCTQFSMRVKRDVNRYQRLLCRRGIVRCFRFGARRRTPALALPSGNPKKNHGFFSTNRTQVIINTHFDIQNAGSRSEAKIDENTAG